MHYCYTSYMEYQVPQFIEVEDRIIGPLTLKQFIYLAGSGGLCVVFFAFLPFIFAVMLAIPFAGLGIALAFYKVNGKAFIDVLEAGFNYYTKGKLFLWKHDPAKAAQTTASTAAQETLKESRAATRLTRGKLTELAWSLDVKSRTPSNPSS
jgi:hypothetical protein